MSRISSSPTAREPEYPARHVAIHDRGSRHWRGRAIAFVLVFAALTGAFVLYSGTVPLWSSLRMSLSTKSIPAKFNDQGLRQLAIRSPRPTYPKTSLEQNVTGVVVANVRVDLDGRMRSVKIVESPDAATGRAVRDALSQWIFKPLNAPRVNVITGDLIFYFHLADGRGVVLSSDELQTIKFGAAPGTPSTQAQPIVKSIDESEFRLLRGTSAPIVLDIRSRAAHLLSHRDDAINIPIGELDARSRAELPRSGLIVIDCFVEQQHSGLCGMAVHLLTSRGFSDMAVLNRGGV